MIYVDSSACSRDSRPRDWSRLGPIFVVSVSPIISRDSRDWGQLYFLILDLVCNCKSKAWAYLFKPSVLLKYIYSEKATKFCKIFPIRLTVCTVVKSKGKISQNFVAFSEYMNFITNDVNSFNDVLYHFRLSIEFT